MEVHCGEGVPNHTGPERCVFGREAGDEASAGESIGQPLSREIINRGRRRFCHGGRQHGGAPNASASPVPREQRPWHVRKLLVRKPGDLTLGRRREPKVRVGKATSRSRATGREAGGAKGGAKENAGQAGTLGTPSRDGASHGLDRGLSIGVEILDAETHLPGAGTT